MFNNIKRNLVIFNKDIVETSWLKSLLDDVPKPKHLQILYKCLAGEYTNVDPKYALKKISYRMLHPQKPLTALKSLYIVHSLEKFLLSSLTEKIIDNSSKDPADLIILSFVNLYYAYLTCSKNNYDRVNNIFRMYRQLEVLLLKTDIKILQIIAISLFEDMIKLYNQLDKLEDYNKYIRASKQVRKFIDLKGYLNLSNELQTKINSLNFIELQSSRFIEIQSQISNTTSLPIRLETNEKPKKQDDPNPPLQIQLQEEHFENCYQVRKMSLQASTTTARSRLITQNTTTRATSIRNNFYIPTQGPLSFLIPS